MNTAKRKLFNLIFPLLLIFTFFFLSFSYSFAQGARPPEPQSCFEGFSLNFPACAAWFANGMLTLSGYLTWMGGLALNYAIDLTIIKMGNMVNSIEGIQYGWAVLRDIANIGLIFGLLAIGIGIILQISSFGSREVLARLIIIAILLNFSLFITKAIVAVGNSFAIVAYSQLNAATGGDCTNGQACISDRFVEALRLPTIYKSGAFSNTGDPLANATTSLDPWKIFLAGVFGSVFLIITGFIFLAGAILLITRFVILVLLMITAPIAWISHILPKTDGLWKTWWSSLWKETFFAPAYLILLLITLYIAQDSAIGGSASGGFSAMLAGDTSSVVLVIYFGIITGFMIAALILARKIGSYGSGAITSFGQKLGKNAWSYARQGALQGVGGATLGLGGRLGRNTLGRYALSKADDDNLKKKAAQGGLGGALNRLKLDTAERLSKSSFDARRIGGVGKKLGIGEGQKGGYEKVRKDQIKKETDYAKKLGKFGEDYARQELRTPESILQDFGAKEGRTILTTLLGTTTSRREAAKKILEKGENKAKARKLRKEKSAIERELRGLEAQLRNAKTDAERADLGRKIAAKEEEKETKQDEIDELKQKVDKQTKEEDEKKDEKKEGGGEGKK